MSLLARASLTAALIPGLAWAQTKTSAGYSQPPKAILEVMQAPSAPSPVISPSRDRLLLVAWDDYPSISRVATPYLRLAGARIEPKNHSKHDTPGGYGIAPAARSYEIVRVSDGFSISVKLPEGGIVQAPVWSSDGLQFAFARVTENSVELWVGNAETGVVRQAPDIWLNQMLGDEIQWMPDRKTLLVKTVPKKLGAPPAVPDVPPGPSIQESIGGKGQSSTYETRDTLGNLHDEDLFDYYSTSQLALVDAATGSGTSLGELGKYLQVRSAPDGHQVLVSAIRKPYSDVTTFDRFPREVAVWDISNRSSIRKQPIVSLPLADRVPIDGEPLGPREFAWRPTDPATLIWVEAQDGGDWNTKVPHRDKVMTLKAPFKLAPVELFRTEQRFSGLMWGERPGFALIYDYDHNKHWTRTFIIN